jgi:hypothetical protein
VFLLSKDRQRKKCGFAAFYLAEPSIDSPRCPDDVLTRVGWGRKRLRSSSPVIQR